MELTKKLSDAFNKQINAEMWSSNLYLQMGIFFADMGLEGCAHWMRKQAEEEMEHAHRLIDYSVKRGGKAQFGQIEAVPTQWEDVQKVFEQVYSHECHVSRLIDQLMDVAVAEDDKATQEFLRWFINEQVEEEETAKGILDKFAVFGVHALWCIDTELGKR